ncbi:MAG: DUF4340 domain-containing protein [Clostridiales bacterium]|nr:DUF4340 domain-containing protein [Clostridiales bacterium]
MSKKKQKQLIGVVIALAAVIVLLLAVMIGNIIAETAAAAEEEAAKIYVETVDSPMALTFESPTTEALSFTETDDETWAYDGDADFDLDDSTISSIVSALEDLEATYSFTAAEELSSYGLEEPDYTLTVTDSDGNSATLYIGATSADGDYYAMLEGDSETIYTLDSTLASAMYVTLYDMANLPSWPDLDEENVSTFSVTGDTETTITVASATVEVESDDGDASSGVEPEVTTEYYWMLDGQDITEDAFCDELTTDLDGVSFTALAAFKPDSDALAEYGLDAPIEVYVSYESDDGEKVTVTLSVGAYSEDDDAYYCILNGDTTCVYLCDSDDVDSFVLCAAQGYAQAQADAEAAEEAEEEE